MPALLKYNPDHHRETQEYLYLLISLVMLILIPPIASYFQAQEISVDILFSLVTVLGIYVTTDTAAQLKIGISLGALALLFRWLCIFLPQPGWFLVLGQVIFAFVFLIYISFHLAKSIINSRNTTISTIYGAIAGFLLLGLISAQIFMMLELFIPGSLVFNEGKSAIDYIYFSYVILTGIGFGDIVPVEAVAKSFSVLIGISGQIYLTVLIAILIGKFLSESNKLPHESD
ncbi:MAG: ion channel [Bacteroidota bacterium]